MELLTALMFYFGGVVTGAMGIIVLTLHIGTRLSKNRKEDVVKPKKVSISDRMKRIKELTTEQLELSQRADGPQKNSLDGKYKNGIIGQIKALDEEKNAILVSILEDGHDPELTTMDSSGVVSQMKLSEYMAYMGIKMQPKNKVETSKAERIAKFTIVKGGKDDGGNTTH